MALDCPVLSGLDVFYVVLDELENNAYAYDVHAKAAQSHIMVTCAFAIEMPPDKDAASGSGMCQTSSR